MEIFNIGPLELLLILILALVVFGPEGMVKFARDAAILLRRLTRSSFWRDLVSTTEEIKTIPRQLAKEADLEDSLQEINQLRNTINNPDRLIEPSSDSEKKTQESDEIPDLPEK
jgi:Sec-independent protein translocase protein TatA